MKEKKSLEQRALESDQRLKIKQNNIQLKELSMRSRILNGWMSGIGDFDSARRSRFNQGSGEFGFSGWGIDELTPDEALIPDLTELRKLSNTAVRNDPIAKGIIAKIVQGVISTGLSPRPAFNRTVLEQMAGMTSESIDVAGKVFLDHFLPWTESTDCDYGGRQNLYQRSNQVAHVEAASGETFIRLVRRNEKGKYGLQIQHIHPMNCQSPPDKLSDPYCVNGVEIDPNTERPIAYWFIKDPLNIYDQGNFTRIPAVDPKTKRPNILHIYNQLEPGQTRGIPRLSSDLKTLANIKRVNDANVLAELTRSYFTAFITTNTPQQWQKDSELDPVLAGNGGQYDSKSTTPGPQVRMGAGAINFLRNGESAQIATPQSNSTYEAWLTAHLKILGMSQEIPYEVLLNAFQSSYSASRAARLAWKTYCTIKRWQFVYQFLQPVTREFIWVEQALGRLDLPGYYDDPLIAQAYESVEWDGDAIGLLDPEQEAKASQILMSTGISNLAEQTAALTGSDWRAVAVQRAEEKRFYKKLGLDQPELFDKSGSPRNGSDSNETA